MRAFNIFLCLIGFGGGGIMAYLNPDNFPNTPSCVFDIIFIISIVLFFIGLVGLIWPNTILSWFSFLLPTPNLAVGGEAGAMEYIAGILGIKQQDIMKEFIEPAWLLTQKARSGKIQVWGKRVLSEYWEEPARAEETSRPIPKSDWNDIELDIMACQPYTRKPQTKSVSQSPAQNYTDLHVNFKQIKAIKWLPENTSA